MTCAYKGDAHAALQTEPNLQGGSRVLNALRFVGNVLTYAFELSHACNTMLARQRGRRKLCELDDHLLKDIGMTRTQAARAARKWFWQ